jgi:hypothetical protein
MSRKYGGQLRRACSSASSPSNSIALGVYTVGEGSSIVNTDTDSSRNQVKHIKSWSKKNSRHRKKANKSSKFSLNKRNKRVVGGDDDPVDDDDGKDLVDDE